MSGDSEPDYYIKIENPQSDDIEWAREVLKHHNTSDSDMFKPRANMKIFETDDSILQRVRKAHELVNPSPSPAAK